MPQSLLKIIIEAAEKAKTKASYNVPVLQGSVIEPRVVIDADLFIEEIKKHLSE